MHKVYYPSNLTKKQWSFYDRYCLTVFHEYILSFPL